MKNLKKLLGFPIGVMMLVISYIGVYAVCGNEVYQKYLQDLSDVNVLVNQAVCAGIFYLAFGIFTTKLVELLNNKDKIERKEAIKTALWFILASIVGILVDKFAMFKGEDVVDILIGSAYILLMIGYFVYMIKNILSVHSINKKLENRNK